MTTMTDETTTEAIEAQPEPRQQRPSPHSSVGTWWREGMRTALFFKPRWTTPAVTPRMLALLVLMPYLVGLPFERLSIVGPAFFYWPGILSGWLTTLLILFACWLATGVAAGDDERDVAPSALGLFAMAHAQMLPILIVSSTLTVAMVHKGVETERPWLWSAITFASLGWYLLAQIVLVWRSSSSGWRPRLAAAFLLAGSLVLHYEVEPVRHWYPQAPQASETDEIREPLKLTQELLELQPQLLASKLQALTPGRKGAVDVYAITFAPYAEEDVFMRESQMVASVMQERFGASGKTIQLVNHRDTARLWPWATPLNLQRAIQAAAQVMNREEDVLFIHLTSHGARDGQLAAEFSPLEVDSVTPAMLRRWLDDAGIRHRVISISACFSGSWIEPLSEPGTLVMTAADASHTSYGCGRGAPLTFFGRAMYDEQLRHTRSFEKAHAAARTIIEQRERDAGKTDGYSNPQIRMGEAIRGQLLRLEAELAKQGP